MEKRRFREREPQCPQLVRDSGDAAFGVSSPRAAWTDSFLCAGEGRGEAAPEEEGDLGAVEKAGLINESPACPRLATELKIAALERRSQDPLLCLSLSFLREGSSFAEAAPTNSSRNLEQVGP